jgi:hypothetical protein
MAAVCILGKMEENMKVCIYLIRKVVMEFISGLMEGNTKDNGIRGSKMGMEPISNLIKIMYNRDLKLNMVYGNMEGELNG